MNAFGNLRLVIKLLFLNNYKYLWQTKRLMVHKNKQNITACFYVFSVLSGRFSGFSSRTFWDFTPGDVKIFPFGVAVAQKVKQVIH